MSKKRKTPAPLAQVVMFRHQTQIEHTEEILRVKRGVPVENQADHIRNKTEAEMIAFMNGYSACLEEVMHEFNCYAGFQYYGPQREGSRAQIVDVTSPDYMEWRRRYYTNGIAK